MRGQWDNEQLLSPSLVRSAVALLGGLLATLALINLAAAIVLLLDRKWLSAATQAVGGLAIPFALWLAVRMLQDMLALQHRSHDKFASMADAPVLAEKPQPTTQKRTQPEGRAGDDGVNYPES